MRYDGHNVGFALSSQPAFTRVFSITSRKARKSGQLPGIAQMSILLMILRISSLNRFRASAFPALIKLPNASLALAISRCSSHMLPAARSSFRELLFQRKLFAFDAFHFS